MPILLGQRLPRPNDLSPARGQQFPQRHRGENAGEASQAQGGFVGKKSLRSHVFSSKEA